MNYLRFIPIISVVGAVIGYLSFTQLWVHEVVGYDWSANLTGMGLMDCGWGGFECYIPLIMVILATVAAVVSVLSMFLQGFWFAPFISLVMGIVIMALNSVFSMWYPFDDKIIHFVDSGFWLAYACGAVIVLGCALQYSLMFRRPARGI